MYLSGGPRNDLFGLTHFGISILCIAALVHDDRGGDSTAVGAG